MSTEAHNIILDHLPELRDGQRRMEQDIADIKAGQISIRNDLHALRGDLLRQEGTIARLDHRLERVENRLGLVDA